MSRFFFTFAFLAAATLSAPSTASAQEAGLTEIYGNGVHAFFSGRYSRALEDFNTAIDAGSQDPRVFYYRGLVWQRLNDPQAADEDFARGAALEAGDASGLFGVDRALERIQGRTRLAIERHRTAARTAALRQLGEDRDAYSRQIEAARPEVTVPPPPGAQGPELPLEAPVQRPVPSEPAPNQPANEIPPPAPAEAADPPAEAAPPKPAEADPFKEVNPFAEPAKP